MTFTGGGDSDPAQRGLELAGHARDLRTGADGEAEVLAEATVRAVLDGSRVLGRLETSPAVPAAQSLVGERVAGGFRAAVDQAVPDHRHARSPLYLLLDDLPVAALISGYADLYRRDPASPPMPAPSTPGSVDTTTPGPVDPTTPGPGDGADPSRAAPALKADICSGWRSDGTMMVALREEGRIPITVGPIAPALEDPSDPWGWHRIEPLGPGAMRRRRLIDVTAGDPLVVRAMFRDTHADSAGVETVLHEYTLELELDPVNLVVHRSEATPRVLPWVECPAAAASAHRLEGQTVEGLRSFVRGELAGTSTCTHLNDLLRSIADVGALVTAL